MFFFFYSATSLSRRHFSNKLWTHPTACLTFYFHSSSCVFLMSGVRLCPVCSFTERFLGGGKKIPNFISKKKRATLRKCLHRNHEWVISQQFSRDAATRRFTQLERERSLNSLFQRKASHFCSESEPTCCGRPGLAPAEARGGHVVGIHPRQEWNVELVNGNNC